MYVCIYIYICTHIHTSIHPSIHADQFPRCSFLAQPNIVYLSSIEPPQDRVLACICCTTWFDCHWSILIPNTTCSYIYIYIHIYIYVFIYQCIFIYVHIVGMFSLRRFPKQLRCTDVAAPPRGISAEPPGRCRIVEHWLSRLEEDVRTVRGCQMHRSWGIQSCNDQRKMGKSWENQRKFIGKS